MKRMFFSGRGRKRIITIPARLRKNFSFYTFLLILFSGIAAGTFSGATASGELVRSLDTIFLTNYELRCTRSALESFGASFACAFIFMLVFFLLGMSLWGFLITSAVPFVKGYGYGISVSFLYHNYGMTGILYNALMILPGAFICCAVTAAAAREAFRNSLELTRHLVSVPETPAELRMKKYFVTMLWLLFLAALSSLADMVTSILFSPIFKFN